VRMWCGAGKDYRSYGTVGRDRPPPAGRWRPGWNGTPPEICSTPCGPRGELRTQDEPPVSAQGDQLTDVVPVASDGEGLPPWTAAMISSDWLRRSRPGISGCAVTAFMRSATRCYVVPGAERLRPPPSPRLPYGSSCNADPAPSDGAATGGERRIDRVGVAWVPQVHPGHPAMRYALFE
jgi:hypothetical protein